MSIYSQYAPLMNGIVDETLSDVVWYSKADSPGFVEMQGFFLIEDQQGYVPELDDMSVRRQLKISKAQVESPARGDRIKDNSDSPIVYQPVVGVDMDAGDYWIFNLQRTS